jgi:hypothetical protein
MAYQRFYSSQAIRHDAMTSTRPQLLFTLLVTGLMLMIVFLVVPSVSWGYVLKDEANGTHLSLFGFTFWVRHGSV